MNNPKSQSVTIPLDDLLFLALGSELQGTRAIPLVTATILDSIFKDGQLYKIQFDNFDGSAKEYPLLRSYKEWDTDYLTYLRRKRKSDEERIERNIVNANIKIISIHLMKMLSLDESNAKSAALKLLKNFSPTKLKALGCPPLVSTEEEIPPNIEHSKLDTRQESGTLIYGSYIIKE